MEWSEFLAFLSRPNGIAMAVGVVLSLIIEYWPAYEALVPKWKRAIFFGLCLLLPLAAALLGALTAGQPWSWGQTFWPALVAGGTAFGSGTLVHMRKL